MKLIKNARKLGNQLKKRLKQLSQGIGRFWAQRLKITDKTIKAIFQGPKNTTNRNGKYNTKMEKILSLKLLKLQKQLNTQQKLGIITIVLNLIGMKTYRQERWQEQ